MVTNNNTEVSRTIRDGLKINQATENVPVRVAESIVPVFKVNPEPVIEMSRGIASDATSFTNHTCRTDKRTFLIGATISVSKDASNDGTYSAVFATGLIQNTERQFLEIRYEPSKEASNLNMVVMFPHPIELKKGSLVRIANQTATASIDTSSTIWFYETDDEV